MDPANPQNIQPDDHESQVGLLRRRVRLLPRRRRRQISSRLLVIHGLHCLLLAINLFIMFVSIRHWERNVPVALERISTVNSAISVTFQSFFTASILLLYLLSSSVAIDSAIRHPKTLQDLDFRLYAWTGLGSSFSNAYYNLKEFRKASLAICVGIPLYFVAGEVLKVTSSSVLGVGTYSETFMTNVSEAAASHIDAFKFPALIHADHKNHSCSDENPGNYLSLWQTSRVNMLLSDVNNTLQRPGLQGKVLHDTVYPKSDQDYDAVKVNATELHLTCAQVENATVSLTLRPVGSAGDNAGGYWRGEFNNLGERVIFPWVVGDDHIAAREDHSDAHGYAMQHDFQSGDGSDIWVNVSMPRPPYWSDDWYGNGARDLSFSNYWDLLTGNDTGSMRVFLQPWGIQNRSFSHKEAWGSMPTKGISNQFVFALVSRRYEDLVVDLSNSPGKIHNTTAIMGPCASACLYSSDPPSSGADCLHTLAADDIASCVRTLYTQVIGCSLETSTRSLNLTKSGLMSANDTDIALGTPPPHQWSTFSWQNPQHSDDFLAHELLNMFVPAICSSPREDDPLPYYQDAGYMQGVLTRIINSTVQLNEFEDALGNLTASYLWNVWQQCDSAFQFGMSYEQCNNGSSLRLALASNTAEFTTTKTLARLEIVWWKSVVTVICSLILFCLAFMLLGTHSDTPSGQPHRQARFTETALLMKDSRIPELLASGFKQDFPLRYRTDGRHINLDVAEYDEAQEKADDPFETESVNKDTYSLPELQLDRTSYLSFE